MPDMTLEQLKAYPNYAAVSGKIYKMASSGTWSHNGHTGGKDLTSAFQGKHPMSYLSSKEIIGNVIESTPNPPINPPTTNKPNNIIVIIIIVVILYYIYKRL